MALGEATVKRTVNRTVKRTVNRTTWTGAAWTLAATLVALACPGDTHAMCGCMVMRRPPAPNEQSALLNKASVVVMMRDGTHTVLTLSNDFYGPAEDFAIVIPVPTVLRQEDVRTLDRGVLDRVQAVAAPHLVDLWEQDPCPPRDFGRRGRGMAATGMAAEGGGGAPGGAPAPQVVVEAQFSEGEYDITILGANDSTALLDWLRNNGYFLPSGAEPVLRSYIELGMKFFVARVDIARLRQVAAAQQAQRQRAARWMPESLQQIVQGPPSDQAGDASLGRFLSPLRIHYESEQFALPVRLGLLNSAGEQDLVVHVLSPGTRYELANYGNRVVPTNVHVRGPVARTFSRFYDAFVGRLSQRSPRRVLTEYAGPITPVRAHPGCVGCARPGLAAADLDAIGEELLPGRGASGARLSQYVLTRLHYRYGRRGLPDDLVFRPARPIAGGHESATQRRLPRASRPADRNDYRVRFIAQHYWSRPLACSSPRRGQWGGAPWGVDPEAAAPWPADRPIPLTWWIRDPVPEIGILPDRR